MSLFTVFTHIIVIVMMFIPVVSHATAQRGDIVTYEGERYALIGVTGELPTPAAFGMDSESNSSANWRGYFVEYSVSRDFLTLDKVTLNAKEEGYLPINGIEVDLEALRECFSDVDGTKTCYSQGGVYEKIDLRLSFTGKIRLGRDFIRSNYVHMGFQKPSAFQVVYDLTFEKGKLVAVVNRSDDAARIRGEFARKYRSTTAESAVDSAFSLEMEPLL